MRVLITGFGPFGDVSYNPSWDAAQAAAEELAATAELLEVTQEAARLSAERLANYDVAVHFGVAVRREKVCFERYAHNWWADLHDTRPVRLHDEGPTARESGLPLDDWAAELGYAVSHDAGTYVCNATLYHALEHTNAVTFVHIPAVKPDEAVSIGRNIARVVGFYTGQIAEIGIMK